MDKPRELLVSLKKVAWLESSDKVTYKGNCHCGVNRFEVQLPEVKSVVSCDCNLCKKKSYLWAYPDSESFKIIMGSDDTVTEHQSGVVLHKFCSTCGTGLTGIHTGQPMGINIRSLLGVNPFNLDIEPRASHGKKAENPVYIYPPFPGDLPSLTAEHTKLYNGCCGCGAISVAVATKPLPEVEVTEDNCSICVRSGLVGIYPTRSQVAIIGKENATEYQFGSKFAGSPFCKVCGVQVFQNLYGPPRSVVDSWPEARQAMVKRKLDLQPVNVRTLEGVEWGEIEVKRSDEGTEGYILSD